MPIGIILAAGDATRLPGKVLLPISKSTIAIESSLTFARELCEDIIVVHSGDTIPRVLAMRGWQGLNFVPQSEPLGVCDAISKGSYAAYFNKNQQCLVFFGDNVYDKAEVPFAERCLCKFGNFATVRESDLPELDGYDEENASWVARGTDPTLKLAGWLQITKYCGMQARLDMGLPDFLNKIEAKPVQLDNVEDVWWDIGTPANYEAYIETLQP